MRLKGRPILTCTLWNLRMLRKNPRMILSLIMGFLVCFLLTEKTIALSRDFGTAIQILEPFIWCFADSDSILFASLALLLLLSQIPCLDTPALYLIYRSNRLNWLLGQVLTAIIISLGYTVFLLVSTVLLTLGNATVANAWSDTATLLSFSPAEFEVALVVVRKTIKLTTPYCCAVHIFWLTAQYALLLTTLNLAVSLRFSKRAGMFAVILLSLLAYILTPNRFMTWLQLDIQLQYKANLLAAWISPLQQATFIMHNFGYDRLPTLRQTHLLLGGFSALFLALSYVHIRRTSFQFTGGNNHEHGH